jgi:hypothetical protein
MARETGEKFGCKRRNDDPEGIGNDHVAIGLEGG